MFDLGKLVFDFIFQLIIGVIDENLNSSTLSFLEKRKVRRRIEDATAEVVESLVPFLQQEKISQEKQERLIETCIRELKPFAENPAELFKGSLDGQKIFENLYHDKELPQVIIEDGLKDTYSLLFPRIATLLCKIPAAVKDWESEAWSENYRRFDEVVAQLKALFAQVDELSSAPQKGADATLIRFKQMLAQKVGLQLDITGLRADQPYSGKFNDFFVLPEIKQVTKEEGKDPISITEPDNCFCTFTNSSCLSIVVGAPGAGKSTWSKWLQRETLRADWTGIGVRVEFRELKADGLPSIYELVRKVAGRQLTEDLTSEKIRKWLDDWRIAFILDGFDEVKPTDRARYVEWIKEISEFAKGCPFVITSRPLTTNHLEVFGYIWRQWAIESFDKARIITYISKWYDNSPLLADSDRKIDANRLASEWLKDSTIGQLTGNPLLLSTLLMVHHLDGKLPNGRANLYKRYVDGMLGLWDDRHKLIATDIQLSPIQKREVIRGIALHLFLSEQETIDEHILIEWLMGYLPKINIKASATDILLVLRERSGLIVGPGIYSFAHKTIAEFLVAETVLQGDQQDILGKSIDRFHLFEHRNDDRWNTILFLWAGMAPFLDLKSFVDECVREANWIVAYGILQDQYERFPLTVKQELLFRVKSIDDNYSLWSTMGYQGRENGPRAPEIELRGLSKTSFLSSLIRRAAKDSVVNWENFSDSGGKAYNLLWVSFALMTKINLAEWEKILKSRCASSAPKPQWKRLIAEWRIDPGDKNFLESIICYRKAFPYFYGYIYLVVVDSAIMALYYYRRESDVEKRSLFKEKLKKAFDFLLVDNIEKVRPFLAETENWSLDPVVNEKQDSGDDQDLLKSFRKFSDDAFSEGLIDNETREKAQNIALSLMGAREKDKNYKARKQMKDKNK